MKHAPHRADQLVKDLDAILSTGEYELRPVLSGGQPEPTAAANTTPQGETLTAADFFGARKMASKFAGTCAVCHKPIDAGDVIAYSPALRRAHDRCIGGTH